MTLLDVMIAVGGLTDFADGNNQESSSEAVNAWAGLSLWARATGNRALAREAAWLLSSEAASARAYWVDPALPSDFAHHLSRRARGLPFWFSLAVHGTEIFAMCCPDISRDTAASIAHFVREVTT